MIKSLYLNYELYYLELGLRYQQVLSLRNWLYVIMLI